MKSFTMPMLVLVYATAAFAQKAGPKVLAPEDIKDCSYWDARIREATAIRDRYKKEARGSQVTLTEGHCVTAGCDKKKVGKTVTSSSASLYAKASVAAQDAIAKYQVEKAKCLQRNGQGGNVQAATAQQQAVAKQVEAMNKVLDAVQNAMEDMTEKNISAINGALQRLSSANKYGGAGIRLDGDPLAALGLEFYDLSQVNQVEGEWGVGAYYGRTYEVPPNLAELERIIKSLSPRQALEKYCKAYKDADDATCENKTVHYFDKLGETRQGKSFRCSFFDDRERATRWCKRNAADQHRRCMQNNTVVRDSASNLSLMDSQGGGFYGPAIPMGCRSARERRNPDCPDFCNVVR